MSNQQGAGSMENLNAFVQTNKQISKGVQTPNRELDQLMEKLKNL